MITIGGLASIVGVGVAAAGILMLGPSGGTVPPRTNPDLPAIADGSTTPATTPSLASGLPSGAPEIAPAAQESTATTRTTGTTTRTRRATVTTSAGGSTVTRTSAT